MLEGKPGYHRVVDVSVDRHYIRVASDPQLLIHRARVVAFTNSEEVVRLYEENKEVLDD